MSKRNNKKVERCCYLPPPKASLYNDSEDEDDDTNYNDNAGNNNNASSSSLSSDSINNPPPCRCCLSSHLLETSHIAIVGSGLAGLSAALFLEKVGYRNLTIYERDQAWDQRKEGYGLTLTYDPRGTLAALGVLDEVANHDCPSRAHYLLDPQGNVRGYFGNAFFQLQEQPNKQRRRGVGQRGNLRVPRQTVRRILLDRLKYSKIQWGYKVLDVVQCEGDQLELVFECQTPTAAPAPPPTTNDNDESQTIPTTTTTTTTELRRIKHDLVIAADGIRSQVVQRWLPQARPAASLNVRIILGLSVGYVHPLLDERGFYTHTAGTRLFVMPFAGNQLDPQEERRFMWQLSFSWKGDDKSDDYKDYSSEQLLQEAMTICQDWHQPVPQMMAATPVATVWGTLLCDRDPLLIYREIKEMPLQRVLVVGDALHAMSPFKGAGANQALQDGRAVAQWLDPNSTRKPKTRRLSKAVKSCMRELVQRTQRVVHESREAARFWHSKKIFAPNSSDVVDKDTLGQYHQHFKFAGVPQENLPALTKLLQEKNIRADTCENLDEAIAKVLLDSGLGESCDQSIDLEESENSKRNLNDSYDDQSAEESMIVMDPSWVEEVLDATRMGKLGQLRSLSWSGQRTGCLIANICQKDGSTPLHVAVQTKQDKSIIAWLVREAGCDMFAHNQLGETPIGLARTMNWSSGDEAAQDEQFWNALERHVRT